MNSDVVINVPISSGFLWSVFFIILVLFGIISWVLIHHWHYYGIEGNKKIFVKSLFFIISIILLIAMVLLIGFYQFF